MKNMIVLVGESASGKSTIEKILADKYGYKKTVSYTTRPPREGEVNGVDYYFITEDEYTDKFNSKYFVETGAYNDWLYGSTEDQYSDKTVCVLTPHGLRQIRKNLGDRLEINAFYIKVPRKDRLIQALQRGDDIDEAMDRNKRDVGQYDGIEDEVDYVIENIEYMFSPSYLARQIDSKAKQKGRK